eukprot:363053-Chlamydomonas_euryale.AAC.11
MTCPYRKSSEHTEGRVGKRLRATRWRCPGRPVISTKRSLTSRCSFPAAPSAARAFSTTPRSIAARGLPRAAGQRGWGDRAAVGCRLLARLNAQKARHAQLSSNLQNPTQPS